ncbi:hypothetical protein BCR33DRAFT_717693, partial [Rhizoclosmatium globosum]
MFLIGSQSFRSTNSERPLIVASSRRISRKPSQIHRTTPSPFIHPSKTSNHPSSTQQPSYNSAPTPQPQS